MLTQISLLTSEYKYLNKYNKKIYYGRTKRKKEENQVVCPIKQTSKLMNLLFCRWWPGENEQLGNSQSSLDAEIQKIAKAIATIYDVLRRKGIGNFFLLSSWDNGRIPSGGAGEEHSMPTIQQKCSQQQY